MYQILVHFLGQVPLGTHIFTWAKNDITCPTKVLGQQFFLHSNFISSSPFKIYQI
jgi:hypothetical protein